MKFEIKIVTDEKALQLIDNEEFISEWKELSCADSKVTVLQEPAFVVTWYKQYYEKYRPVLCIAYGDASRVIGLMPLALSLNKGYLTHAGDHQAEYHGWIAHEDIDHDFPIKALIALKNHFHLITWQWRWIPPRAQTIWLNSQVLTKEKIFVKCREERSPIWNLSDENKFKKLMKNKAIKNNMNRYKNKGDFYIERIKTKERIESLIDTIAMQCDFRQEAIHLVAPFKNDPNKKGFYVERMNYPNDNYFTVLWSNNDPIAFHLGTCDRDTLYLGLSCFDPLESNKSPGTLLLLKLARLLMNDGYRYIDLTPGGDAYKQRFSNAQQDLITPCFYFSRLTKLKSDLREEIIRIAKRCLLAIGFTPTLVRNKLSSISELFYKLHRLSLSKLVRWIISLIYEKRIFIYYKYTDDKFFSREIPNSSDISIQKYSDLMHYTGSNPWISMATLLLEASRRFSSGEVLYSLLMNGVLAHYGWLVKGGRTHRFTEVDMEFKSPKGSLILYDFYTEPEFRRKGLYQRNLKKMLYDGFRAGVNEVYIGAAYRNNASRAAIEKTGFKIFKTFVKTRFLWIVKKKEIDNE